mmetsp:Transcript_24612/g.29698  ORF Transcript_24612/g.29698 Transcript_24612/m.29698 type:complete len:188 (-) Transcript_24612:149-712(-)
MLSPNRQCHRFVLALATFLLVGLMRDQHTSKTCMSLVAGDDAATTCGGDMMESPDGTCIDPFDLETEDNDDDDDDDGSELLKRVVEQHQQSDNFKKQSSGGVPKDALRQNCISALRKLCTQGSISQKQKRLLLTDIISCSAKGEFSMVEVAYELLCSEGEDEDAAEEDFADQCRVFASALPDVPSRS